ncbi:MAG: LacI family DNA-binding transcriptional regulator, partial [Propionicimonas sp.]|nr:LacI family DNA-binding transcriptional regulator [Propionicimonas sp.]
MSSSIRDVAKLAGVSVATVSHVINGTRFVSDTTRAKVMSAIGELQYSPNILARKFKTGSRDSVGFVVPDIANGYFATLIEQVEDVLQANEFRLIVSNTHEDVARELDSLRMLSSGVVDGLVIASTLDDYGQIEDALPPDFPVVLVDR